MESMRRRCGITKRPGSFGPHEPWDGKRLYSIADIERIRRLRTLTEDMGVNLAGAEVALKLMARIEELEADVAVLTDTVNALRRQKNRQNQGRNRPGRPG